MIADHNPNNCPVCNGALVVQRHPWLLACKKCGCLASTLEVRVNAEDIPLDEAVRTDALRVLRQKSFEKVLDSLVDAGLPDKSHILDVGCAHGWFLRQATARGHRLVGIEPDRAIAALALAQGADVRVGMFPEALPERETFDAIVFNDVLEHLPDLSAATTAVRAHLCRNGLFVVNIPLASGFFYRLADALDRIGIHAPFERMWQIGFSSPHRFYLTERQLIRLAERHGFKLVIRRTLPSLRITGLWQRLRYDKSRAIVWALLMWPVLFLLAPFMRLLPQDIGLLIFEAREPAA